ncbi:MAG: lactate utilization protein [Nitrososphaerota archaeon]
MKNLETFKERLMENGSQPILCKYVDELFEKLEHILDTVKLEPAAFHPRKQLASLSGSISRRLEILDEKASLDMVGMLRLCITSADCAVAETGSLVLLTRWPVERLLTSLPEVLVAVVWSETVYPTLTSIADLLRDALANGNAVSVISGPSRTADIEQTFVKGVHGPRDVYVVIVEGGGDG